MFWVYGFVILLSIALGYILWPQDKRSYKLVAFSGLVIGSIAMLFIYITQWWPVEHEVIQKITRRYVDPPKVVYREKIVYRQPGGEVAPVDIAAVCKGAQPLEIVRMTQSGEKDEVTTWVTGNVVGSKILITCGQPGAFYDTGIWKKGDIVQFVRGVPQ